MRVSFALVTAAALAEGTVHAFVSSGPLPARSLSSRSSAAAAAAAAARFRLGMSTYEDEVPSDFNAEDLEGEKALSVDQNEEDAVIRDALKRELLLLSSITNRGEYAR